MVGLAPTELTLGLRLSCAINYIHKSRRKSPFWQLLCFVNQGTMYIFSVGTFWEYGKCTLVIRLVSDSSVVSLLVKNWKSFLFLPSQRWKGPLSHLGPSQPWNRPFCWKFLWHVFLSWSLWCSKHLPEAATSNALLEWSFLSFAFVSTSFFCVLGEGVPACQPQSVSSAPLSSWKLLFSAFLCHFLPSLYHLPLQALLEMFLQHLHAR